MTTAGDASNSFADVEGRIFEIEEGLLGFQLSDRTKPVRASRPAARPRILRWGLTTLLALCGSAAVIGPVLLVIAS